jgi:imidazolonepropionase-like amidohydrolase
MPEVLGAPRVITGSQTIADGALAVGNQLLKWAGPARRHAGRRARARARGHPARGAGRGDHDRGVRIIAGTDAGVDNTPHHQYVGGLEYLVTLGFSAAQVIAMATTEAAAALGVGAVTGRLAPGYEADLIVVDGDPLSDIAALGRLRRVIARGRDYVPDSGRFDVSAPGTPFADREHPVGLRLLREATRRRQA